ncbi:hypothetical protein HPC49_49280 [Pyxidicoccus fallax]|uniref:Uncharacterized protein n=1 Tax=Pyxidicoccus fallax TaxID=394095 RepID=A0A848LRX7_9BACT|nr:hypothetical protein [Pyxidicoccus fallax]NMO20194.1 hypothetical protein [Pyxidicoccus fallax]NPC86168.1 hypothetical protein [Pyxidicoccus fallax]
MASDFDDDDDKGSSSGSRVLKEFDCPSCNANNPVDETFTDQDEVRCNYCGSEFKVTITSEGRVKYKEV